PIGRTWRICIVLFLATAFLVWLSLFAGSQISREAAQLPEIVNEQAERLLDWMRGQGFSINPDNVQQVAGQLMSGVGTVTRAIGGLFGGLTTLFLIIIIGVYVALEPRLYERGLAWMMPREGRKSLHVTLSTM